MPHSRWRGGSPRHAMAMTTALSPDKRMLIQMILSIATQKVAWPISFQPLVSVLVHVDRSIMLATGPLDALPDFSLTGRLARACGPSYRWTATIDQPPTQRTHTRVSLRCPCR